MTGTTGSHRRSPAALYAEVYALGEQDLTAAHERLRALAAEHYSDVSLLLMLASLLTMWAAGMAAPPSPAGEKDGGPDVLSAPTRSLARRLPFSTACSR